MAIPQLPIPEPPVKAQIDKKKKQVTKKWAKRGTANSDPFGINPGGGILSPNNDLARENAWLGSTAFKNAQQEQAQDPFTLLQQQLFNAANNIDAGPTSSLEQLRAMATQQAGAQYDPIIKALMAEMGGKTNRAERNQKTATDMYGGLSKDYLSQLPEMTAQFAAEDKATNSRYDQAQSAMNAEYQENAGAQDALLKQLGIQAAAPDASREMQTDRAYFANQSEMDQQAALSNLNEQQMAQTNYQQNLGSNAKMAGANLSSDIRNQLEDYLTQANSQLTSLQGQRGGAIETLLAQMQSQQADAQEKARQQQFDNMMKMYNFQLDATKASGAGGENGVAGAFGGGTGAAGITTGLQGATNYLASMYPQQPVRSTGLMENLNAVLQNPEVVDGKFILEPANESLGKSAKYSDVGQERMMNLLRKEFENDGKTYNAQDLNATMNALLAYLGKLR